MGSERGGRTAAIVYSLLQTCKALGVDPQAYLEDILPRILDHNAKHLDELLPDRWAAAHTGATEAADALLPLT